MDRVVGIAGFGAVQVGLTRFSESGCGMAEQGLFGVYTRVAQYVDWIEQTAK